MLSLPEGIEEIDIDVGAVPFKTLIETAKHCGEFFYDLETTGLDVRKDRIDGIAFYIPDSEYNSAISAWYPFSEGTSIVSYYKCRSCSFYTFDANKLKRVVRRKRRIEEFLCPACESHVVMGAHDTRTVLSLEETFESLRELFEEESMVNWAFNRKFDDSFVELTTPIRLIKNIRADVMILSYLSDENPKQFGLKPTVKRIFDHTMTSFKEAENAAKEGLQGKLAFDLKVPLARYAMDDVYWTWRVRDYALDKIQTEDPDGYIEKIFWGLEMPITRIVQEIEETGIKIDWMHLLKLDEALANKQEEIFARNIGPRTADWDTPIRLSSPEDCSAFLFGHPDDGGCGLPTTGLEPNAKGIYPTGKDSITHLKYATPVVADLLEWSSIATNRAAYTKKLSALAQESDTGLIYFRINQTGTVIGRFSSSDPVNIQAIPRAKIICGLPGVRYAFCSELEEDFNDPHLGRTKMILVGGDFSQIELRVAAYLAQEPVMLSVYAHNTCKHEKGGLPCKRYELGSECSSKTCKWEGNIAKGVPCPLCGSPTVWQGRCRHMDLHQRTAEDVGVGRSLAKNLNFGNLYRQGASRFCETAELYDEYGIKRIDYAKDVMAGWFGVYEGIPQYHRDIEAEFCDNGFIAYTLTGRRRRLEDLACDPDTYYRAVTQAIQFSISGSAQDIMKTAMKRLWEKIRWLRRNGPMVQRHLWEMVKFVMQIHDELIFIAPYELREELKDLMKREMEGSVNRGKFNVPLIVDAKYGRTWLDIH